MSRPQNTAKGYNYHLGTSGAFDAERAARVLVPLLMRTLRPMSVLDVGCGLGHWLREFELLGAKNLLGLDGSWVPLQHWVLAPEQFNVVDLSKGFNLRTRFDLALCLEVAEHLPAEAADRLVTDLVKHAKFVVFSAAVPGQGGHEHINERPQSYWIKTFAGQGYQVFDVIRPALANSPGVAFWYRQNALLFCSSISAAEIGMAGAPFVADWIAPELYAKARDPKNYSLSIICRHLFFYLARFVRARFKRRQDGK